MKKPAISVVIPAYNEEKYLPICLSSLQKQTFRDFEVIVVDNNSTDKTAQIARSFGAKVVKEKIQGMIPARERGFKEAQAEIIARTDADSLVSPNWIERIFKTFTCNPHLVAVTGSPDFIGVNRFLYLFIKIFVDQFYFPATKILMGHWPLNGPTYAVKKSVWQKITVHFDDKLVHEDIDLSCHLAPFGEILFDPNLRVSTSFRRWNKNFTYHFSEYTLRYFRTLFLHHPFLKRHPVLYKTKKN